MQIFEGTVITCDPGNTVSSFLVEDKGRILFTGDRLPREYQALPRQSLGRKTLVPAFVDTHMHFSSFALFHSGINTANARTNGDILLQLSRSGGKTRGDLIVGFGLSPHSVEEKKMITREELDSVLPDSPVFMVKYDGHACVINSALLRKLPDRTSGLRGYDPETGMMGQEAFFAVTDFVTGSISPMSLIKNMLRAYEFMIDRGFGMFHTVSGVGFPRDLDVDLERWLARGIRSRIQTRLFFQTMNTLLVKKRKLPRIGGCFATALDGCFGSVDAALSEPYEGSADKGVLYYQDDEVINFCRKANREGLQIEIHAIGDAAFDQASRALEAALKDFPREDHRHGIIHACLPTERGMDICARNRIQIPVQPAFLNWPLEPSSYLRKILGNREGRLNPLRTLWDRGILLSGGSDAPCTTPDPLHGIYSACNHPVPEESLTAQEALRLFTINGYQSSFDEKERGSLEQGKFADMVILSENPLEMPREKLNTLKVEKTILRGSDQHPRSTPVPSLLRGMMSSGKI